MQAKVYQLLASTDHPTSPGTDVLQNAQALGSVLIRQMQDLAVVVQPEDGRILLANPVAAQLLGVQSIEGLMGKSFLEFTLPEDQPKILARFATLISGMPVPGFGTRLVSRAGESIVGEITPTLIVEGGRHAILLIAREICPQSVDGEATHTGRTALACIRGLLPNIRAPHAIFIENFGRIGKHLGGSVPGPRAARDALKGEISRFHASRSRARPDWLGSLDGLADQAAIALQSLHLYIEQQQINLRLTRAYDETIDGWSRALDLRDEETQGHSQRVTDLTLRLARQFGVSEEHLVHIRRGARLHDIGKIGIPDAILRKPGELTPAEWEIMRRHPALAVDLIYPIEFLRPALDIPFCHHEKWDGTGYPQRLRGEEIPLAARIFAVVDVWDALTHDRPYRAAWSGEHALRYIREQSDWHFDPKVVAEFLQMMEQEC